MRDELQELVDQVSRLLAAPVTLEDADFTLLAFCAHDEGDEGVMDAVRTRSILTRGSPPATRRWFEEFGIAAAAAPLRTPADPASGIRTRLVLPVRHAGRTRGYLWLLDEGRTDPTDLTDPALAAAVELAAEAGRLLAARTATGTDLGRSLRTALTGPPAARERAARALAGALGGATPSVLVALVPAGGLPTGWRPPGAGAVSTVLDGSTGDGSAGDGSAGDGSAGDRPTRGAVGVAVLVPLRRADDLRPAGALAAAGLARLPPGSTAGVSAVARGSGHLVQRWRQATAAARLAAAVPRFSPVAQWAELGAWRLVSDLPGPDPAVVPLLADPVLAATVETWLDCAASASRAAAELRVHRQTLYYRLSRAAALTGLDLADGEHRLLLHASLKAARIEAASHKVARLDGVGTPDDGSA